jgi:hypothetical protein
MLFCSRISKQSTTATKFIGVFKFQLTETRDLEKRQLHFDQMFGKRKILWKLLDENSEFLQVYLQKCISLHSKMDVGSLTKNIDDLFRNSFE